MAEPPSPAAALPLGGLTLLLVEDSRFAAEALRLIALRAGARLRRAETVAQAERHLSLYAPDCLIVDCGLPDGDGCALIAAAHHAPLRPRVILGLSGDGTQKPRTLAAGADGFLGKPLPPLPQLLRMVRPRLRGAPLPKTTAQRPDRLALQEDLRHALLLLQQAARMPPYIADFITGLAAQCGDRELAAAADAYRGAPLHDQRLRRLIGTRIAMTGGRDIPRTGLPRPPAALPWAGL